MTILSVVSFACLGCRPEQNTRVWCPEEDRAYKGIVQRADSLLRTGSPELAIAYYKEALGKADSLAHIYNAVNLMGVIGRTYLVDLADVRHAEDMLLKQEETIVQQPGFPPSVRVENCLALAQLYRRRYDLPHSSAYALLGYHVAQEAGLKDSLLLSRTYAAIGAYHHQILEPNNALDYFHLARTWYPLATTPEPQNLGWLSGLINVYNNAGVTDSATYWIEYYKRLGGDNRHIQAETDRLYAILYFLEGNSGKCIQYAVRSIESYTKMGGQDPYSLAFTMGLLASAYQEQGRYDQALVVVDSALIEYFGTTDDWDAFQQDIYAIDILSTKAEVLTARAIHAADIRQLKEAVLLYEQIENVFASFVKWDISGAMYSRFYNNFLYAGHVKVLSLLAQLTKQEEWLHKMHGVISLYKGHLFNREQRLSSLRLQEFSQDQFLEDFISNDVQLERLLFDLHSLPFEEKVKAYPEVITLYRKKRDWERQLEGDSLLGAAFHEVKAQISPADLFAYASGHDAAVVNFYIGDRYYNPDKIYALVAYRNSFQLLSLSYDSSLEARVDLLDSIHRHETLSGNEKANTTYLNASRMVYQTLMAPILEACPGVASMVVMPDEALHRIVFEALVTGLPDTTMALTWGDRSIRYLLDSVSISYAFSPNRLADRATKPPKYHWDVLAMAFTDEKTLAMSNLPGLPELAGALAEIRVLREHFKGDKTKFYTGYACTREHFFKHASQAKVLHLSTHGRYDPGVRNSGMLYMRHRKDVEEIRQYEIRYGAIRPELLVLSACESGAGELVIDEGMISIGRIFQANGAGKLISARWPVSDRASTELFNVFYQHYSANHHAEMSFRDAQLALRHHEGRFAFPGHWAGYAIYL